MKFDRELVLLITVVLMALTILAHAYHLEQLDDRVTTIEAIIQGVPR